MCTSQKVQIVIAEQGFDGIAQLHTAAQHFSRGRASVHQVTQYIQGIATGRKRQFFQQLCKRFVASLDVTN